MRRIAILDRLARSLRAAWAAFSGSEPAAPRPRVEPSVPHSAPLTPTMRIRPDFLTDGGEMVRRSPFEPAVPAPGVVKDLPAGAALAMDDAVCSSINWAQNDAFDEGLAFLGYPYLAQLTQRPEYRKPSEIIAKEMTRRWIRFTATGDETKKAKIAAIEAEFKRLKVQDCFRRAAELDGFFGRGQIFISVEGTDDSDAELGMPLSASKHKLMRRKLRLQIVEPIWTYPDQYNSTDPLRADFYKPQKWHVMGRRVHATRMLTFISRDVPDILKPAYSFGGLSLTQIAKPYVDNWLRTRQSVSDAIYNFSVSVLKTNLAGVLNAGGAQQMVLRAQLFNEARSNEGLMMLDKETEDFVNVSMPLSGLDKLQAQAQEQMSAVTSIPLIVLLGITPTGLNASSEGELQTFFAWIESVQATLFGPPLDKLLDVVQLSLFGEIDPSIGYQFEPLMVLSDVERATVEKTKAETDGVLIDKGIIDPEEARERLANDDDGEYAGLDLTKIIEPPQDDTVEGGEGGAPGLEGDPNGSGAPVTQLPAPASQPALTTA